MIIKLFGQGIQSVPTSFERPALLQKEKKLERSSLQNINIEQLDNALAMALGYQWIVETVHEAYIKKLHNHSDMRVRLPLVTSNSNESHSLLDIIIPFLCMK